MIAHVLLQWFIAQHETKSAARVYIDGLLQIQCLEGNHFLCWFCAVLLNNREGKLIFAQPVVGHVQNRTIFQIKLRHVRSFLAIIAIVDDWSLVSRRKIVHRAGRGDGGVVEHPGPEEITVCRPTIESRQRSTENKGRPIHEEHWRKRAERPPRREK